MLISLESNFAFLALPKTGSTSIETAIAPFCDISFSKKPAVKHMTLKRFHRFMSPYLAAIGHSEVETMALIREPIDWLASWYRYRSREALKGRSNSTAEMSFEDFAEAYMAQDPPEFARVGQPSIFLSPPSLDRAVTHLFRYEEMDAVLGFFQERLGQPISLDRLNSSPDRETPLSAKTRARLESFFEEDYALWSGAAR